MSESLEKGEPEKPRRITRREFLKIGAVGVGATIGAAVLSKFGLFFPREREQGEESLFYRLRGKIRESQLPEFLEGEERISKQRLLEFVDSSEKAAKVFSQFHQEKDKLKEVWELTRRLYPNPDLVLEDQIFFLRDEKILREALQKLDSLNWKEGASSLERNSSEIVTIPQMMHSLSDESSPKESWYLSPVKIALLYSEAGTKRPEKIEFDVSSVPSEIPISRVENARRWVGESLERLPLPKITAQLLMAREDEQKPFWGHTTNDIPRGESRLELGVVANKEFPRYKERVGILSIHEAAHAIDVQDNPGIIKYLSVKETLELYLLRLQVALDTQIPNSERILRQRYLRGERVLGRDVGTKFYDMWLIEESAVRELTQEELGILFSMYAYDRWSWSGVLFLSEPVYEVDKLRRELWKEPSEIIYKNWAEFLEGEQEKISVLSQKVPLLHFVVDKILQNMEMFSTQVGPEGAPAESWWARLFFENFRVIVAEDLLTKGGVKNYVSPDQYKEWIRRIPYEVRSTNQEKLADEIAFILFLVHFRDVPLSQFDYKSSIKYLTKLREIWESKF